MDLDMLYEKSFHERAYEEIQRRDLQDHEHVAIDFDTFESIKNFVNYKLGKLNIRKELDPEFKAALDLFDFVPKSNADIMSEVEVRSTKDAPIWPRSSRVNVGTPYVPRNGTLLLPEGGGAEIWTLFDLTRGRDGDVIYTVISYHPEDAKKIDHFLNVIYRHNTEVKASEKIIEVVGGKDISLRGEHTWEDLVLTDTIKKSVQEDLEFWMASEDMYKRLAIPYRRGYLFEGPPGNGKTAVTRTILSTYDFSGVSFNFSNRNSNDADLSEAFERAADSAPSVFIMEDIDRLFAPDAMPTGVTKEGLLNCLDGVSTYSGIVVIATANHPEYLDKAIRHRPGRFDVPVAFHNPHYPQRREFMLKLLGSNHKVSEGVINTVAEKTEGKSMAFIKLVYESCATRAWKENPDIIITDENVKEGLNLALSYWTSMETEKDRKPGFGV